MDESIAVAGGLGGTNAAGQAVALERRLPGGVVCGRCRVRVVGRAGRDWVRVIAEGLHVVRGGSSRAGCRWPVKWRIVACGAEDWRVPGISRADPGDFCAGITEPCGMTEGFRSNDATIIRDAKNVRSAHLNLPCYRWPASYARPGWRRLRQAWAMPGGSRPGTSVRGGSRRFAAGDVGCLGRPGLRERRPGKRSAPECAAWPMPTSTRLRQALTA
jgi:hypothetical protein